MSELWKFFEKNEDNQYEAVCKLCNKLLRCTTTGNLKKHLKTKHGDVEEIQNLSTRKKSKDATRYMNSVWRFFTETDQLFVASCNICGNFYSYKSTTGNLRAHLVKKHSDVYDGSDSEDGDIYVAYTDNEESTEEQTEESSSSVWQYFERETGGRPRCAVCRATVAPRDLARHLRDHHPKLLQDPDQENAVDEESYSEIVYVSEPKPKKRGRPKRDFEQADTFENEHNHEKKHYDRRTPKTEKRRTRYSTDDEPLKKPKTDEISHFGNYITTLLRTVPTDTSLKLQMDIVNMIMNAKLQTGKEITPVPQTITVQYATVTESEPGMLTTLAQTATAESYLATNTVTHAYHEDEKTNQNDTLSKNDTSTSSENETDSVSKDNTDTSVTENNVSVTGQPLIPEYASSNGTNTNVTSTNTSSNFKIAIADEQ